MRPLRIEGHTRYLGKPEGWEPETDGDCGHLAIRDENSGTGHCVMASSWEPMPDELKRLKMGAPVLLYVYGTGHPPVMLGVGKIPEKT